MRVTIDKRAEAEGGRLVAIRLSRFTLRSIAVWRRYVGDLDQALLLSAVAAVTADHLTRADLDPSVRNLGKALPPELVAPCNISSLATAAGINRETARRKIRILVESGFLAMDSKGLITFGRGLIQEQRTRDLVHEQLEAARRLAEELIRDSVLKVG